MEERVKSCLNFGKGPKTNHYLAPKFNLYVLEWLEQASLPNFFILSAFSIGFFTRKFRNSRQNIRYIYDIDLKEVSLVTLPSNGYAKILPKVI